MKPARWSRRSVARIGLSLSVFMATAGAEAYGIAAAVAAVSMTDKQLQDFMLLSMGVAFLPFLFLIALVPVAVALFGLVAYVPARLCWVLTADRVNRSPTPRERMLERMEVLKRMTPDRDR